MNHTIQVSNCLTCPFLTGRALDHECSHENGPDEDAVARAILVTTRRSATVAEGCPLRDGATLVQLRV